MLGWVEINTSFISFLTVTIFAWYDKLSMFCINYCTLCRWNTEGELSSSDWFLVDAFARTAKPPSSVWDHLDRRERQFITPHHGKDKPHLMKQPGQSCIKSHRTVSCSAICTPPLSPQWVSGTADAARLVEEWVHFRWRPGLLWWSIVTSDEWYRCCEIWHISGLHHHVRNTAGSK